MSIPKSTLLNTLILPSLVIGLGGCSPSISESQEEGPAGEDGSPAARAALDPQEIEAASGAKPTTTEDGVVRIGWSRDDVEVSVGGMDLPPPAGLGSWAAFTATENGAMVMGDNVVFEDEVDAAMDAAFAHGLEVTALHNHFFYDAPKVYFMHIGGEGEPAELATGVKAMWDAIRRVRSVKPNPAERFAGPVPETGEGQIDPGLIEAITGLTAAVLPGGVVKVTAGREARMHGAEIGASMGLSTWAAFSGADELAAMDGDFAMRAEEVTPVLRALRRAGVHVVAVHNHMVGESPSYIFVHFWAVGSVEELARAFAQTLEAQQGTEVAAASGAATTWAFDDLPAGEAPPGWKTEGTNQRGPVASWSVEADATAPSQPNALALTDTKEASGSTYNLCWADQVELADGAIEVKVKAGTGREDQGGGPIWRVQDRDNYYIARWNPLEDNFRVYSVKNGRRVQLASADVDADPTQWHTILIENVGEEIRGSLDGQLLLEVRDDTFSDSGGVGLWTKADAATSFDDLRVERQEDRTQ